MRIHSLFDVLVFMMAVLTFSLPCVVLSQQNEFVLGARLAAQRDAQTDADPLLWGGCAFLLGVAGGCLLGAVGIIGAYAHQPPPPAERLLGKSPEYILSYTNVYKTKIRRLHLRFATLGCLGGSVVAGIFWGTYDSQR